MSSSQTFAFVVDPHGLPPSSISVSPMEGVLPFVSEEAIEDTQTRKQRPQPNNELLMGVSMDWSLRTGVLNAERDQEQILSFSTFRPGVTLKVKPTKPKKLPATEAINDADYANGGDERSKEKIPAIDRLFKTTYRKYTETQINQLLYKCLVEGEITTHAARDLGINERTAQNYVRKARKLVDEDRIAEIKEVDSDEDLVSTPVPVEPKERKYGNQKLFKVHTQFFLDLYEANPTYTVNQAHAALLQAFEGMQITPNAVSKHLAKHCQLTLKKLEVVCLARNSLKTIENRRAKVLEWQQLEDFDYTNNCVFIDEAGFNVNMRRYYGRSVKGTPAKSLVSVTRGVSLTIIGAMCELGVVNLFVKRPTAVVSKKKRKIDIDSNAEVSVNGKIGTRTEHFMAFLVATMDELDAANLNGRYLVLDNAPIHRAQPIKDMITSRGYKYMFLPPYSPFLNPIEEMWSKVKYGVKRNGITDKDTLVPRIIEAAKQVTTTDCEGWIRHSTTFFGRCLELEPML